MIIYEHTRAMSMDGTLPRELTFVELCEVIAPIAKRYGITRVHLFGSRARGDNRPDSDYDFIIAVAKGVNILDIADFYGDVADALNAEISLDYEETVPERFMNKISKDMRLVYAE